MVGTHPHGWHLGGLADLASSGFEVSWLGRLLLGNLNNRIFLKWALVG